MERERERVREVRETIGTIINSGRIASMKRVRERMQGRMSIEEVNAIVVLLALQGRVYLHRVDREKDCLEYGGEYFGVITLRERG